ncbi:MAG: carboxymuconolactone decarboxylase family protein [Rhodospirillales bacterium]
MQVELGEKSEHGLAVIAEMRGQNFSDTLRASATSGKFGSAITRMALDFSFADSWGRDGLARRDRSLVIIGALIAMRQPLELKNHIKIGVANGLTLREIEEVLVQATSYVGFPCIATAMTAVIEALREIGMDPNVQTSEERGLL